MNASRMVARLALAVVVVAVGTGLVSAQEKPATKPAPAEPVQAAGRWNITVDTGTYKHPSWLAVDTQEGGYIGQFLGGAGSVGDIGEVKVDGPKIEFNAHGLEWTGTIKGDTMTGTRANDKGEPQGKWTGKRAVYKIDLSGRWYVKRMGEPVDRPAAVQLAYIGDALTGSFKEGDEMVDIEDARVTRDIFLAFSVPLKSGTRKYTGSIKGDVLEFIVGEGRRRYRAIGHRQREWGKPVELFNGKDLSNWKPLSAPDNFHWKVVDGIMTNTGGGGSANIVSKQKFRDFRMHVEFKVPLRGNSGVYLRGRHEIQVSDSLGHNPSWGGCGALYSRIPPAINASRPHDEWQTLDATLVGRYLTVVHNGQIIINNEEMKGITGGAIDSNESEPGPIYLQGDHGEISYRKITIWPAN